MSMLNNAGLIESLTAAVPDSAGSNNQLKGFNLRKVLITPNIAERAAKDFYPKAEIVHDLNSIINDDTIELVIVYGSENGSLDQVAQVLKAGKRVRLL